ncbi:C-type lectin domain family 1 member B-like [Coregonus clupeaformis]|uniref:C-type lectin domain family 1 member B-like n=1 Tax=Coregonus clupeaformis TaxID=59861 RepID=UPI001E1C3588|nr:C-type lectin domain family 1 member B-like [Coregonus clupeaformis]
MKNTDIDGQLYANVRAFKPSTRDGVVASVHVQWWKRPSGVAAVCLGLLCVLLLAGIIGLSVYYGVIGHHESTERDQLQASYNNLTEERDQLQTSYNTLTEERDQKPCLAGWWKFGTSCYYLSSTMNTAGGGQKECRTMGGEYWMDGEPNNLNDQVACVEISQTATDPLKSWKDGPCVKQHWVCEKPITQ